MTMFGADIQALRGFAGAVEGQRDLFEQTRQRLAGLIDNLAWHGSDRDLFVSDWHLRYSGMLGSLVAELDAAAGEARWAASAQERTSEAGR